MSDYPPQNLYKALNALDANPVRDEIEGIVNQYKNVANKIDNELSPLIRINEQGEMMDRLKKIKARVDADLNDLAKSAREFARVAAPKSHLSGRKMADAFLKKQRRILDEDGKVEELFDIVETDKEAVKKVTESVTEDMLKDVNMINSQWKKNFDDVVRDGINEISSIDFVKKRGSKNRGIGTRLYNKIRDRGVKLEDSIGRKWSPERYVKMYARTRSRELQTQGIENRMKEYDKDLVKISEHVDVDGWDICNEYESHIYSLSGNHPRYPALPERPPFHPNCAHVMTPWIEKYNKTDPERKFNNEPGNFTDPSEASEWLKQKYDIDSDFVFDATNYDYEQILKDKGLQNTLSYSDLEGNVMTLDMDLVNDNMKKFDKLAKQYPEIADRLEYLGTHHDSKFYTSRKPFDSQEVAHASQSGKYIGINPKYYHSKKAYMDNAKSSVSQGWSPANAAETTTHTLSHEFGHQVHNYYLNNGYGKYDKKYLTKIYNPDNPTQVANVTEEITKKLYNNKKFARGEVSGYANTNFREAFAEGFSAINEPNSPSNEYIKYQRKLLNILRDDDSLYDIDEIKVIDDFESFDEKVDAVKEVSNFYTEFFDEELTKAQREAIKRRLGE